MGLEYRSLTPHLPSQRPPGEPDVEFGKILRRSQQMERSWSVFYLVLEADFSDMFATLRPN